jgi:hypothetical protein
MLETRKNEFHSYIVASTVPMVRRRERANNYSNRGDIVNIKRDGRQQIPHLPIFMGGGAILIMTSR